MSVERRRGMVERDHQSLSLVRQCRLLGISRGSIYYQSKGESAENLVLMRQLDEQYLKTPWYGCLQMARALRRLRRGSLRKPQEWGVSYTFM